MRYACGDCRKKFRSAGALEMHNQAKHKASVRVSRVPAEATRLSALRTVAFGFCGCLLALVVALAALFATNTQFAKDATPKVAKAVFARP